MKKLITANNILSLLFIGGIVCYLTIIHIRSIPLRHAAEQRIEKLHVLTPQMIEKIEVYGDAYGYNRLDVPNIDSSASKGLFVEAMHDLTDYSPNHDKHTQEFFIRTSVATGEKYEFSIWLRPNVTGTAFMSIYDGEKDSATKKFHPYFGTKKSSALCRWLESHKLIKEVNPTEASIWDKIKSNP